MKTQYRKGSKGDRDVEEENYRGAYANSNRRPERHASSL
jgi:hypothetical protein